MHSRAFRMKSGLRWLWSLGIALVIGSVAALPSASAQEAQPPDNSDTASESETGLPKLESMVLPTAEELMKRNDTNRGGQPLDWVVLHNDDVIVTKPVYPRPQTLEKMQAAIDASLKWPRPDNDRERARQRQDRAQLRYLVIEIEGEPEYQIDMKQIKQIVYHEDMMLQRIDSLITDGKLREAFEMLYALERSYDGWPGAEIREQNLVFRDAGLKKDAGDLESALALLTDLHARNPEYPGAKGEAGTVVDKLVADSEKAGNYNRAQFFIGRLRSLWADHETVKKWTDKLSGEATQILDNALAASQSGQHDVAASLALESSRVWPVPPNRRAVYARMIDRYQRIVVGVERLPGEPSAYFLETDGDARHNYLTTSRLFELDRNDEVPRFQTRFFEQWEPTDLGRRIDFRLMARSSFWETRPVLTASQVVAAMSSRLDPSDPRYDERFAAYIRELNVTSPFEFGVVFNRVPLRPEALMSIPIRREVSLAEDGKEGDDGLELLTRRFELTGRSDDELIYRRAVPEPDRVPVYHVAEVIERKYDNYRDLVQSFLRKEVLVIPRIRPWEAEAFKADNRFFTLEYSVPETHVLQFNPVSEALRNREFRRALAYSIDRERLLKQSVLRDNEMLAGRLVNGPFASLSYAHSPLVEQREYDLTLGLSLAIAARHALGGELPKLKMVCPPDPVLEETARKMIATWKRIKIDVELIPNDGSVDLRSPEDGDWDIVFRTNRMEEPLQDLWPFLTMQKTARIEDLTHFPDWLRIELIQLDSASSWSQAVRQLHTLHRHLMEEVHLIPLWEVDSHLVMWRNVAGPPGYLMHSYQNIERWIYKP